jgi:hypothetical protein
MDTTIEWMRIHYALRDNCATRGITLIKQSIHSPEFNMLDLGVWWILKAAVERRSEEIPNFKGRNENKIEAKVWEIVQDEWNKTPPEKLYSFALQRRQLLQKCIELEGKSIIKEVHNGMRKIVKQVQPAVALESDEED